MEILFVSHKYPPATGGMEKQSYELINGMKALTKVHHILYDNQESRVTFFTLLGRRIRAAIKENPRISIIHFNDGLIAAFSLFHFGYPHLKRTMTLHGLDVVFPGIIYQKIIIPRFNNFDLLFAVSRATANACVERGIDSQKIVVVNNGVSNNQGNTLNNFSVANFLLDQYQLNITGKKLLIAMGRPVKRKGFSWFVKNVMPVIDKNYILLIIGPIKKNNAVVNRLNYLLPPFVKKRIDLFLGAPSDEADLEKLIIKAERRNVVRLGKLPVDQINAILKSAVAFLMPNIEVAGDMEGFGLVCVEAALQGTLVLAAASGGITDAITHGKNGILMPPGHISSWIQHLHLLAESNQESQKLLPQDIINYTSNRFSWEKMCKAYLDHFSDL